MKALDALRAHLSDVASDGNHNLLNLLDPFALEVPVTPLLTIMDHRGRGCLSERQVRLVNKHFNRRVGDEKHPLSLDAEGLASPRIYPSASCFWSGSPLRVDQLERLNTWAQRLKALDHDLILYTDNDSWGRSEFREAIRLLDPHIMVHLVEESVCFDRAPDRRLNQTLQGMYCHYKLTGQPAGMSDVFRMVNEGRWYFDLDEDPDRCAAEIADYVKTIRDPDQTHIRIPKTMAGFFGACPGHPVLCSAQHKMAKAFKDCMMEPAQVFDGSPVKKRFSLLQSPDIMKTTPFVARYFQTQFVGSDKVDTFGDNARLKFPHFFRRVSYGLDSISQGIDTRSPRCLQEAIKDCLRSGAIRKEEIMSPVVECVGELGWIHCIRHDLLTASSDVAAKHIISMAVRQLYFTPGIHLEHEYGYVFAAHPGLKDFVLSFLQNRYCYQFDEESGVLLKHETAMDDGAKAHAIRLVKEAIHREQNLMVIELNREGLDKQQWTDAQYQRKITGKGLCIPADTLVALPNLETQDVWIGSVFLSAVINQAPEAAKQMMLDPSVTMPEDAFAYLLERVTEENPKTHEYHLDCLAAYMSVSQLQRALEALPSHVALQLLGLVNTMDNFRLLPEDETVLMPWLYERKEWMMIAKFYEGNPAMAYMVRYSGYTTPVRNHMVFNKFDAHDWQVLCAVVEKFPTHIRQELLEEINALEDGDDLTEEYISKDRRASLQTLCDMFSPVRLRPRGPQNYEAQLASPTEGEAPGLRASAVEESRKRKKSGKTTATSLDFQSY